MEIPQRIACRAINCNKTFSDHANERKHSRKKHPELIGSVGISLQQQAQVQDIPNSDPFYEEEVFVIDDDFENLVNVNLKLISESISRTI